MIVPALPPTSNHDNHKQLIIMLVEGQKLFKKGCSNLISPATSLIFYI